MNAAEQIAAMFGFKPPIVAARIKAEPGFHVVLAPTKDPTIGCLWIEVEEWGLCAAKIMSLDMFTAGADSAKLVPLVGGKPIAYGERVQVGECFAPGVTAEDALDSLKKRGFIAFPREAT